MTNNKKTTADVYSLVEKLRAEVREIYVTKAEFGPVKAIVYGMVGVITTAVLVALVAKVVQAIGSL